MERFVKSHWKLLLLFTAVGLLGGYFVGLYSLESYPEEIRQEILAQGLTETLVALISAVQSAIYGLVLGALGIVFSKKVGLWRDTLTFEKKPVLITAAWSIVGGLCLILPDLCFFGNYEPAIRESYLVKPTIPYLIATVTYGGIIEEVMLRLFMMSLVAFVLHKLFQKDRAETANWVLVTANVICALLFAAGHLPATQLIMGLTPMIVFRCFLLNGGFGLLFGWLYRKYGLQYAMLAHGGCHMVSKLIWILFV
ncbi:MAG: CPBP family intramembrane metalloprotease [Oscillospiraceae bacterium]|nr:CPBP family intramembrane metalloprotease [Oscillospiraceae bacterium]